MLLASILTQVAMAADVTISTSIQRVRGNFRASNTGSGICTADAVGTRFEGTTMVALYSVSGNSIRQRLENTAGFGLGNRYVTYGGLEVAADGNALLAGTLGQNVNTNLVGEGTTATWWSGSTKYGDHVPTATTNGEGYYNSVRYDCNGFTEDAQIINPPSFYVYQETHLGFNNEFYYSRVSDGCVNDLHILCASLPAGANGDPHFVGFRGQRFNFDGYDGGVFSFLSMPNLQVNMRISELDVNGHLGTWMTAFGFVTRTSEVVVSDSGVLINGQVVSAGRTASNDTEVLVEADGNGKLTRVEVALEQSRFTIRFQHSDTGATYLNIDAAVTASDKAHGVLGQTMSAEFSGIEGSDSDYVVADGLLGTSTNFAHFSRVASSIAKKSVKTFTVSLSF